MSLSLSRIKTCPLWSWWKKSLLGPLDQAFPSETPIPISTQCHQPQAVRRAVTEVQTVFQTELPTSQSPSRGIPHRKSSAFSAQHMGSLGSRKSLPHRGLQKLLWLQPAFLILSFIKKHNLRIFYYGYFSVMLSFAIYSVWISCQNSRKLSQRCLSDTY